MSEGPVVGGEGPDVGTELTIEESRERALAVAKPMTAFIATGAPLFIGGVAWDLTVGGTAGMLVACAGFVIYAAAMLTGGPLLRHLREFGSRDAAITVGSMMAAGVGGIVTTVSAVTSLFMGLYATNDLMLLIFELAELGVDVGLAVTIMAVVASAVFGLKAGLHRNVEAKDKG